MGNFTLPVVYAKKDNVGVCSDSERLVLVVFFTLAV